MFRRWPELRSAVVNLKSGTAFRGVIWGRRGGFLVLRQAVILRPRAEQVPVDGETLIPEREIEFVQLPPERGE